MSKFSQLATLVTYGIHLVVKLTLIASCMLCDCFMHACCPDPIRLRGCKYCQVPWICTGNCFNPIPKLMIGSFHSKENGGHFPSTTIQIPNSI